MLGARRIKILTYRYNVRWTDRLPDVDPLWWCRPVADICVRGNWGKLPAHLAFWSFAWIWELGDSRTLDFSTDDPAIAACRSRIESVWDQGTASTYCSWSDDTEPISVTIAVAVPSADVARPTTCAAADEIRGIVASARAQPVHGSQTYTCASKVYHLLPESTWKKFK